MFMWELWDVPTTTSVNVGGFVFLIKTLKGFAVLTCFGMLVNGVMGCSDDSNSAAGDENNGKNDGIVVFDPVTGDSSIVVINPETGDTSKLDIDSTRVIDPETGDTVYRVDTNYIPIDTTLHWVGNSALVITEVTPVNLDWLDENGEDPGWVEIYNAGEVAANLKGYALVENLQGGRKWIFGDELIAAKSFRTVFCDKKNLVTSPADTEYGHGRTHTNWKLEKDGGSLYLIDPFFGIRDSVNYPKMNPGVSWGIVSGGAWKYFDKPTPEKPNNAATAYEGFAPTFSFSGSQGGFYKEPVTLNPPATSDGLSVRCTQDGSAPTKDSQEFSQPITIETNTVLRCAAFKDGLITKNVVTNTYLIGETVKMPVVAVSVDPSFFTKHYLTVSCSEPKSCPSGLYEDVELPVHVEYFAEGSASTSKAFEIDAGISLMGNYSRMEKKKSVAIVMREQYQDGRLDYPLFETRKETHHKFKAFNLRNNGNRFVSDYFEDSMAGAILEGSGVDYQRSRQVVVFYNGKYYGIHDMRERFNRHYVESNYGIDADNVEIVKHLGREITGSGLTDVANYTAMLKFVAGSDFSGENNANYTAVKGMMDVGNFADYMIAEMYDHNGDWPNNNVRAWRSPEQPWKFMIYDVDHGFDWEWTVSGFSQSTNMFKWVKQGGHAAGSCYNNTKGECFHTLYVQLIKNPDFKRLFVNHASVMLSNYLNAANVSKVVDAMASTLVSSETSRDLERFGQDGRYYQNSCGNGFSVSGSCMKEWAESRDTKFRSEMREEFGLSSDVSVSISSNGSGVVLMDGMVLPGSTASSTKYSGTFFGGVQMELTAVPANGAVFTGWSDGSSENPHIVTLTEGMSISANFK